MSSINKSRFAQLVKSVGNVYLSARDPLVPTPESRKASAGLTVT